MTDFDNNNLNNQPEAPVVPTPQDPTIYETVPLSSASEFGMPEPPQAPDPSPAQPQYQPPVYQQPDYQQPDYQQTQYAQQPDYQQAQYAQQPYQQPYQQQPYQQPQQPQQAYKPRYDVPPAGYQQKSRLAAGLLALLVGSLGIHNFYLGNNTKAIIQLLVTLFGCGIGALGMEIWALIEGIQYLVANNANYNYDGNGVILKD